MSTFSVTTAKGVAWNGPVCQICGSCYLDAHTCTEQDILRRVKELLALLPPEREYAIWGRADEDVPDW